MYSKVKNYVELHNMFQIGDIVLAGVSGGGDSMAMLHILCRLMKEMDLAIGVVHVQHGIRGDEAERDCKMVQMVCEKWNIPCSVYRYDVPQLSEKWKMGTEETARIVRKEAFSQEIKKRYEGKNVKIALAHNKNDLAETMIHNLARGTGLRGLAGIPMISENIVRPLLCVERKEIDEYLMEHQIIYVTDSTNLRDDYTRNRIRHHVLPLMEEKINGSTVTHMAEAARIISAADEYLRKKAHIIAKEFRISAEKYFVSNIFDKEDQIIKEYTIMEILENLAGKRKDLTKVHVEQVLKCFTFQTGKYSCLPYQIIVKKDYNGVWVQKKSDSNDIIKTRDEEKILLMKNQEGWQNQFSIKIFPYKGQKICEKKYTKWFDYDKIEKDLYVRKRESGDYIVIDKSGRKKKLTRYMIDERIPKEIRDSMEILAIDSEVIWVPGYRISEAYKISEESKNVLEISYSGGRENG